MIISQFVFLNPCRIFDIKWRQSGKTLFIDMCENSRLVVTFNLVTNLYLAKRQSHENDNIHSKIISLHYVSAWAAPCVWANFLKTKNSSQENIFIFCNLNRHMRSSNLNYFCKNILHCHSCGKKTLYIFIASFSHNNPLKFFYIRFCFQIHFEHWTKKKKKRLQKKKMGWNYFWRNFLIFM